MFRTGVRREEDIEKTGARCRPTHIRVHTHADDERCTVRMYIELSFYIRQTSRERRRNKRGGFSFLASLVGVDHETEETLASTKCLNSSRYPSLCVYIYIYIGESE